MKARFVYSLLCICCLVFSYTVQAQPVWKFRVAVAVEKQTADYFQQAYAKDITSLVKEQMATVSANFNKSGNFNGIYTFEVGSVYVFTGPVQPEVFGAHPGYEYKVVINGFSDNAVGGGWYGSYQTIYHSWTWNYYNGPFGSYATDGLTHEFGHARGAVDIYGMRVDANRNPVNNSAFEPVNSIMNYPYGNITWDEYTTNLLNSTGAGPIVGEDWITRPFPASILLTTVDATGRPLDDASIDLYPVDWYSNSVNSTPTQHYRVVNGRVIFTTDPSLQKIVINNPFQPSTSGYPWTMRYCNFLVKATYGSTSIYNWMPLYDVQNAYFRNGPKSTYTLEMRFPASLNVIDLYSLNNSQFYPGAPITAYVRASGLFEPDNTFTLQIVDKANNAYVIGSVNGTTGATISGQFPDLSPSNTNYRAVVVSSKPKGQSLNDRPVSVVAAPSGSLTLLQPFYNCATGAITFRTSGGDKSPVSFMAPGITGWTTNPNQFVDRESRTADDVQPFVLTARQGATTVTLVWNLKAACGRIKYGSLALLPPTYDCATGAITFRTSGGDGTPVSFMAPGITGWTTNPNQFVDRESRTVNDVQPFVLTARQSATTVSMVWDLKAACGRARQGVAEVPAGLQVVVLGNPIQGQSADVEVSGAAGQPVQLKLADLQGRQLYQQTIQQAYPASRISLPLGSEKGLFLLQVSTPGEQQQIRLLKP